MARKQSRSSRREEAQTESRARDQSLAVQVAANHKTETKGGSP
jgi:hypothetical protein